MDFIRNNLGPNKVTIEITPNDFEESISMDKLFRPNNDPAMDNIIEIFRSLKYNNIPEPKNNIIIKKGILYCFLSIIEPEITLLYKKNDIDEKIDSFRNSLILNLENHHQLYKKLHLNKVCPIEDIKQSIQEETNLTFLLTYLSRLTGRGILVIRKDSSVLSDFSGVKEDSENGIYVAEKDTGFEVEGTSETISGLKEKLYQINFGKYLADGTLERVHVLMVSDLRKIAEDIGISIYKINEDGKKKYLLKNDLKEAIRTKIDLSKTQFNISR